MEGTRATPCSAFAGTRRLASGPLEQVVLVVKAWLEHHPETPVLTLDDRTGKVVDLDVRGTPAEVLERLPLPEPPRGPGRPRLGVVAREVTLLPRHWEWLNAQPGGASVALRKLVEEAGRAPREQRRQAQERTFRAMSALGGDEAGYEEALRALYAGDPGAFGKHLRTWPEEIRAYVLEQARAAFPESSTSKEDLDD